VYWCTFCGKQFAFDENMLKEEKKSKKKD